MNRLITNDLVVVTSGKHKGKQGRIKAIHHDAGTVVVEGVNVVTRNERPNARNQEGGRVQKEAPIAASNVMPLDPQSGKPTRVKIETRDGKKVRVAKSGAVITTT
jgi:large subunit ribosomal protein L24